MVVKASVQRQVWRAQDPTIKQRCALLKEGITAQHAESEETGENRLPIPEDPHQTVWEVMTIFTSSAHGVLQVLEEATLARGTEE